MSTLNQTVTVHLSDMAATQTLAGNLAHIARPGDVFALTGDLGAGKTEFARAFIRELTLPDEDVPSPTFTLVQTYEADAFEIWHFDLYRLDSPDDAFELGIEDAFHEGVSLIEWAEHLGPYLPRERLEVHLSAPDTPDAHKDERIAELVPHADWAERLKEAGYA